MFVRASALVAALLVVPVWAGVTNITHPAYYSTIHDAVNAAIDGDTLLVSTGRYAPDWISMSAKRLQILGGWTLDFSAQLAVNSVVDGVSYVAGVGGGTCLLQRLTLMGAVNGCGLQANSSAIVTCQYCTITGNTNNSFGAGVRVTSGARAVLENTAVQSNMTINGFDGDGAGIYVGNGAIVIGDGCSVKNNVGAMRGGGLHVSGGSADITGMTDISGNYAPQGGGIYARNGATVSIHDNADVRGNYAGTSGGGVYLWNATLRAWDSSTYIGYPYTANGRNVATNDGGNIYAINAVVIVSNGAACANGLALQRGGGIYLTNSALVLAGGGDVGTFNGTYHANEANGSGGGVYAMNSTVQAGSGSDIAFGRAGSSGGGVYALDTHLTLTDARVLSNACDSLGAGILMMDATVMHATRTIFAGNDAGSRGGAVYATGSTNVLCAVLVNCAVSNNSAANDGGAIRWYTVGTLTARNSTIMHNRAGDDGGALAAETFAGRMVFESVSLYGNTANGDGGGCHVSAGRLILVQGGIERNSADADGNGTGSGGGIYVGNASALDVSGAGVYAGYNRGANGGGICAASSATVTVTQTGLFMHQILRNTASGNGGGIYANHAIVRLGCYAHVFENDAQYGGGVFLTNGALLECQGSNSAPVYIFGNHAWKSGGGVCAVGSGTVARLRETVVGVASWGEVEANCSTGSLTHGGGGAAILKGAELDAANCQFLHNVSSNRGGGLYVWQGAAVLSRLKPSVPVSKPLMRLWNNSAARGGAICAYDSVLVLADAELVSNRAVVAAGAAEINSGRARLVNCVLARNSAPDAAAVLSLAGAILAMTHCTVAFNATNDLVSGAAGICVLTNCIAWGTPGVPVSPGNPVCFSDIQGGYAGAGNISANPLFFAPAALDYQLSELSPCRDTGTPAGVAYDMFGTPRPFGAAPDLGAYEFVPEPGLWCMLGICAIGNLPSAIRRRRREE